MIVILPTGTGFLVGTVDEPKYRKTKQHPKRANRPPLGKYWTEVREWMRAAVPSIH